ncbi:MAG: hypothetical protein E6G56_05425 [Actinobacteria bacterium]|nr:MAG: hypothetical protein E6G56_05425 [Actinomycetota bacterium]
MPNRRPDLRIVAPGASSQEAAAVVAALERFMRETAPAPAPAEPAVNPWVRAARLEAVDREEETLTPWGDDRA